MMTLNNLSQTDEDLNASIQRLSTGLRINDGSDDPAGMIISENMRSELQGINQAIRNSQDAANMAKTADGALSEVQKLLIDMRALAVHAANSGALDASSTQADQTQIQSILSSIDRVASTTEFGTKKLLDGTAGTTANVTDANDVASMFLGGTFNGSQVQNGPVTLARVAAATRATVTLANQFTSASAIITTSGSVVVNGYSVSTDGTESVQSLVAKINAVSSTTGATAQIVQNASGKYQVLLSEQTYGSHFNISYFDPNKVLNSSPSASATGSDAVFNVSLMTSSGLQTVTFTGGRGGTDSGLKLTDAYGNSLLLTETGNSALTASPQQVAQVTAGSVAFQVGADSGQSVSFSMPTMFAKDLGTGVVTGKTLADIDLTTTQGAQDAMKMIEAAVTQVATVRGVIGSFQKNILESGQRSLQIANENLAASESAIRDVDMAAEMTNYTKLQILKQSGLSVLAQANQQPQSVLSLIRGQ
jgi:flagellin